MYLHMCIFLYLNMYRHMYVSCTLRMTDKDSLGAVTSQDVGSFQNRQGPVGGWSAAELSFPNRRPTDPINTGILCIYIYIVYNTVYGLVYGMDIYKHRDPTISWFLEYPPFLGLENQNAGSLCLCGLWGPFSRRANVECTDRFKAP